MRIWIILSFHHLSGALHASTTAPVDGNVTLQQKSMHVAYADNSYTSCSSGYFNSAVLAVFDIDSFRQKKEKGLYLWNIIPLLMSISKPCLIAVYIFEQSKKLCPACLSKLCWPSFHCRGRFSQTFSFSALRCHLHPLWNLNSPCLFSSGVALNLITRELRTILLCYDLTLFSLTH